MHNTGNPLGSTSLLDLYDNAENIDYFANSQQDEVPDRFGTKRLTLSGLIKRSMALRNEINDFSGALTFKPEWTDVPMNVSVGVGGEGGALNLQAEALGNRSEINKVTSREALRRSYAEAGYNLVDGSFEAGGTLADSNDVLLQESTGKAFSGPVGTVAPGTNPVGNLNWSPRTDETLRSELSGPDGVDLVGGASSKEYVDNSSFNASLESTFAQKVRLGQSDCYVLVQGDSTGDANNEWFRLTANSIAAKYPTHTVKYVVWVHASTSWSAPVTISIGSGPRTIWFYNGSRPGAVAGYWTGNRSKYAFNNLSFDVVFTNYGLNVPTSLYGQQEQHAEHLTFLRSHQPYAEVISCIQPVDYSLLDRNTPRSNGQKLVSRLYGVRVVDVMRKFLDLVESTGGDYTPWYIDSLHPSPAGSAEWAKLTTSALLTSKGDQPSVFTANVKNSDLPNGMFKSFLSGSSSAPDFWSAPNTTAIKDQVYYETFGQSVRVAGVGASTGIFRLENANELMQRFYEHPQIVIAARLRSSGGSSGKCGKIFFAHSASTEYTEIQSTQGPADSVNDWFRWVFLLVDRSFWVGKSDFRIGVFSGEAGEFVSIDRMIVSSSLAVSDCSEQQYTFSTDKTDTSHNIPTNTTTSRTFTVSTPVSVKPGMYVEATSYPSIAGINVTASCNVVGAVEIFYSNSTGSSVGFPASTIKIKFSA